MKFLLQSGTYTDKTGRTYKQGDVVESSMRLDKRFVNIFTLLPEPRQESSGNSEPKPSDPPKTDSGQPSSPPQLPPAPVNPPSPVPVPPKASPSSLPKPTGKPAQGRKPTSAS